MSIRPLTLRDILYIFFKNKNSILTVFFTALILSTAYTVLTFPIYSSEIKVLVKLGKEKFSAVDEYSKQNYNVLFQERAQNINNELEIMKVSFNDSLSARLMEALYRLNASKEKTFITKVRIGLASFYKNAKDALYAPFYWTGLSRKRTDEELLAGALMDAVKYEALEDTDVIRMTFRWDDPEFAAYAMNEFTSEYLINHIKAYENERSLDFYVDKVGLYKKKLKGTEHELEALLKKGGISNIALEKELLLKDISEIEKKYNEANAEYEDIAVKVKKIKEMYDDPALWIETPKMNESSSELKPLDSAYFKLLEEKTRLLDAFPPGSREIKRIDSQMSNLRKQKSESLSNIFGIELLTKRDLRNSLGERLAGKKALLEKMNARTLELSRLERERAMVQDNYYLYETKAEQLRISNDLNNRQITSVKIISPAVAPKEPVFPKRKLIIGIAAFLGLFVGFGYSAVCEFLNHTFKDEHDVSEFLGAPLLMTIRDAGKRGRRRSTWDSAAERQTENGS